MSRRPLLPLLASLLAAACAGAQRNPSAGEEPPGAERIVFQPEEVTPSQLDRELEGRNDEELFALGTASQGRGDHARAAAAFARLADVFPGSTHRAEALLAAGVSYERLEAWRLALERFRAAAAGGGPGAVEASFRIAECHYHLRELADARATLDALARREELSAGDRIRALAQRGIVELEDGRPEDAERSLRLAVSTFHGAGEAERLDDEFAAQAQYYLGEIYRGWFRGLPLDPSAGDDESLRRDLEHKAEMLLSAQGHYLRAIRMANDRWAVAAGFRIGELYEDLRSQLLEAPLPPGLDGASAGAYRAELRAQVRVLAAKAVAAYEQTLGRAARAGVDDLRFLSDAQRSLERLEAALAEDPAPGS